MERIIAAKRSPDEAELVSLRPSSFAEFCGQSAVKEGLAIMVAAAKARGEPIDHILFSGPPGLGKTTLAHLIAKEMGVLITGTSGPALERTGDLVSILTALKRGDVLFIDEVHRMNRAVEETLYPAMEEFSVDIVIGKGPGAKTIKIRLERFTLIGATTRSGLLSAPFRDRFGVVHHLDFYSPDELGEVVRRVSARLGCAVTNDGLAEIARRSRGTPRIAIRLLKRIRDHAQVNRRATIDEALVDEALAVLGIGENGLDRVDRLILSAVVERFAGGPVGLETIAAVLNEEPDTIADVYEPYLLKIGLMQKTPRGRVATAAAYRLLGLQPPEGGAPTLFAGEDNS